MTTHDSSKYTAAMLRHVIGYYTAAASASRTNAAVGGEVPMQELRRALILLAKRNEWMAARMERAAADPGSQKMLDGCAQAIFSMLTEYRPGQGKDSSRKLCFSTSPIFPSKRRGDLQTPI